jgi:hypothetical protein
MCCRPVNGTVTAVQLPVVNESLHAKGLGWVGERLVGCSGSCLQVRVSAVGTLAALASCSDT